MANETEKEEYMWAYELQSHIWFCFGGMNGAIIFQFTWRRAHLRPNVTVCVKQWDIFKFKQWLHEKIRSQLVRDSAPRPLERNDDNLITIIVVDWIIWRFFFQTLSNTWNDYFVQLSSWLFMHHLQCFERTKWAIKAIRMRTTFKSALLTINLWFDRRQLCAFNWKCIACIFMLLLSLNILSLMWNGGGHSFVQFIHFKCKSTLLEFIILHPITITLNHWRATTSIYS